MCIKPVTDLEQAPEHSGRNLTPQRAIRRFCVECVSGAHQVRECGGDEVLAGGDENGMCWFFPFRLGHGRPSVKTIRKRCLDCMGGNRDFVAECRSTQCPVHAYRLGKNPNCVGRGRSEDVLARAREALKRARDKEIFDPESTKAA